MADLIDHLAFRAKLQPNAVALQSAEGQLTFAQLASLVRQVAGKLRELGVKPGQVVVTAIADKHLDWVVTLALFHEAAISCSNHGYSPLDASFEYDRLITDRAVEHFAAGRTILLDTAWMADARLRSDNIEPIRYPSDRSPARIFLTSGTTGHRKAVALNTEQILSRSRSGIVLRGANRTLSMLMLSTASDFNTSVDLLTTGYPLYRAVSAARALEMIRRFSIESLHGSPVQIGDLIKEMTARSLTIDSITMVRSVGGSISTALLRNIRTHLSENVVNLYGSTEAGNVCVFRPTPKTEPSIIGYPQLDVQIEIVDASDTPLPPGTEGSIRIRTSHMVDAYHRSPEETAKSFRGGWFYPGDRGLMTESGLLVGAGRDGEIINLGGVKIDPVSIDLFISEHPGVEDGAVLGLENETGTQDLVAVVVAPQEFDISALHRSLLKRFGRARCPSKYFKVPQVPRNAMGKVMRADIGSRLAAIVATRRERAADR